MLTVETDFIPTIGQTYSVNFTCSDPDTEYQGDMNLTCFSYGRSPTLSPNQSNPDYDWYAQFYTSGGKQYVDIASGFWLNDVTVSLTVYG